MTGTGCPPTGEFGRLLSGELADTEVGRLERHVAGCPRCQDALEGLTRAVTPMVCAGLAGEDAALARLKARSTADTPDARSAPTVPGYEVLGELGRGGGGVVYEARQTALNRLVALKFLRARVGTGGRVEAEAVARLTHPNVVGVYEVGEAAGRPYLVLELVPGGSLARRLDGTPWSAHRAATLIETLARAAHAAHAAGVVHRDLKPANILFAADGSPKIADFGLARLTDRSEAAGFAGPLVGTPSYMAPEQAGGGAVGPPADVYALGAVLYELLTGRPPFKGADAVETAVQVVHADPVPPRRLQPTVPRDLDTVCLKCLAKDPAGRYPSADALADDLRRFRAGEPVRARPTGAVVRAWKWAKRRPAAAALAAVGVVAPVLGLAVAGWLWRAAEERADVESRAARTEAGMRLESDRRAADLLVDRSLALCEQGEVIRGMHGLVRALAALPPDSDRLDRAIRMNLAAWRYHLVVPAVELPHDTEIHTVAYRPDGRAFATGTKGGRARVWDAETAAPLSPPLEHGAPVRAVALSPDGRLALTAGADGLVRLWEVATGRPTGEPIRHAAVVRAARFSPDGTRVLTGSDDRTAGLWDLDGKPVWPPVGHDGEVRSAVFTPDGKAVLTASLGGTARLLDAATGAGVELDHGAGVEAVAVDPTGRTAATAGRDGQVRLWDVPGGGPRPFTLGHPGPVRAVAFDGDGETLAVGCGWPRSGEGEARVWEVGTGRPRGEALPLRAPVEWLGISPDGRRVLTVGDHWRAAVWVTTGDRPTPDRFDQMGAATAGAMGPDGGSYVVAARISQTYPPAYHARLYRAPRDQRVGPAFRGPSPVRSVAVGPGGRWLAAGHRDGEVRVWDAATGVPVGPPPPTGPGSVVHGLAFAPDGREVAAGRADGTVRFLDPRTGRPTRDPLTPGRPVWAVAYRPDGRELAAGGLFHPVRRWELPSGRPVDPSPPHPGEVTAVAYRADGGALLTGGFDRTVRLWDPATGAAVGPVLAHGQRVRVVDFSPDGRAVVTGGGTVARVWDAATGSPVGAPLLHAVGVNGAALTSGGRTAVTSSGDQTARVWDVGAGKPVGPPIPQRVEVVTFAPDGKTAYAGGVDGVVRGWAVPDPLPGRPELVALWAQVVTGHEDNPDGYPRRLGAAEVARRRDRLAALGGPEP